MTTATTDQWTCPSCGRTTVVTASPADTCCALDAVRKRHEHGHPSTAPMRLPSALDRRRRP